MSLLQTHSPGATSSGDRLHPSGLYAIFRTREDADLAVEHLAQEYHIDPAFIYVEPIDAENSSGLQASGGDHASGQPSHSDRPDAPLHGAIQVSVPVEGGNFALLKRALEDAGAIDIQED